MRKLVFTVALLQALLISVFASDVALEADVALGARFDEKISDGAANSYIYGDGATAMVGLGLWYKQFTFAYRFTTALNPIDAFSASDVSVEASGNFASRYHLFEMSYDVRNETPFVTTLGLAVGAAKHGLKDLRSNVSSSSFSDTSSAVFAYGAFIGVGYEVQKPLLLSLQFRFLGSDKFTIAQTEFDRMQSNALLFNVRYRLFF